jgi:hypothetical protein
MAHIKIPQYASHRGVTPEYIRICIKKGKIPESALLRKGQRWLVDPVKADKALDSNLSHINRKNKARSKNKTAKTKQKQPAKTAKNKTKKIKSLTRLEKKEMTLAECQRLHEQYKAALKELEFKQKSGELLDAEQVKAAAFEQARQVRDSLMNIPARLGPILAGESDPTKIVNLLNDEFRKALESIT